MTSKQYYDKYLKKDGDGFCKTCEKETKFVNIQFGYNKFCDSKCAHNSDIIKNKTKKTCLKKYGVEYTTQSNQMKDASQKTMLERYGCQHALQVSEFQKKFRHTCLDRFGVDHAMKNKEVKHRVVNAFRKNYGVDHPFVLDSIKSKIKNTVVEHYGVDNVSKSNSIKEKKKETCIEHYGCEYNFQSKEVKDKIKQSMIDNYGFDNFSKTPEKRQFMREWVINRIEEQISNDEPMVPFIGRNARKCLNELQTHIRFNIIREQKLIGYFADGFIKELNLIIEFDEAHHFNSDGSYQDRDIQRQEDLEREGYRLFRIKETDWVNSKESVIKNFKLSFLEI